MRSNWVFGGRDASDGTGNLSPDAALGEYKSGSENRNVQRGMAPVNNVARVVEREDEGGGWVDDGCTNVDEETSLEGPEWGESGEREREKN